MKTKSLYFINLKSHIEFGVTFLKEESSRDGLILGKIMRNVDGTWYISSPYLEFPILYPDANNLALWQTLDEAKNRCQERFEAWVKCFIEK